MYKNAIPEQEKCSKVQQSLLFLKSRSLGKLTRYKQNQQKFYYR